MPRYDVFISYSRKDTSIADSICRALDNAGISYFIDRQEIGGAFEFPEVLANAIIDSELFLYLASENSYASKFTTSEITFAFNEKPKNKILPYIIDGSSLPTAQRFIFSAINWRNISEHPINTILINDILTLLGKTTQRGNEDEDEDEDYLLGGNGYSVSLDHYGSRKLEVIKAIKNCFNIPIINAKPLVESAPVIIAKHLSYKEAEKAKNHLDKAGATTHIVKPDSYDDPSSLKIINLKETFSKTINYHDHSVEITAKITVNPNHQLLYEPEFINSSSKTVPHDPMTGLQNGINSFASEAMVKNYKIPMFRFELIDFSWIQSDSPITDFTICTINLIDKALNYAGFNVPHFT